MSATINFKDGFDYYTTGQFTPKWTTALGGISIGAGRFNGKGVYMNVYSGVGYLLYKQYATAQSQVVVGTAYNNNGVTSTSYNQVYAGIMQLANDVYLYTNVNTGALILSYNGNTVTSAVGVVPNNGWCYIECAVVLSTSATGSYTVVVNGTQTVLSGTSVQTSASATSPGFQIGTATNPMGITTTVLQPAQGGTWDDVYNSIGGTTMLGDVRCVSLMPTANGRVNQSAPSGGTSNWSNVSEIPSDGDVTFNISGTVGNIDCYVTSQLPTGTASVYFVSLYAYSRKDDSASRTLALGFGNGTTESYDSGTVLNTSYTYQQRDIGATNPLTSSAWATGDFATAQSAIKVIA